MTSPANNDPDFYNTHWWEGVLSALGGSTGIAGLQGLTQEAVMGSKVLQIQANEVLNNLLGLIFDGLRNGVSLALAIIEAIAVRLFGLIPGFEHIEDAIEAIQEVPAVEALVSAITGVGGTIDDLADYLADRWTDLAGVVSDIAALIAAVGGDVIEDVAAAIEAAVENAAGAVEDFANLLTGLSLGDVGALVTYLDNASDAAASAVSDIAGFLTATGQASLAALGAAIQDLIEFLTSIPAALINGVPDSLQEFIDDVVGGAGNPVADLSAAVNAGIANAANAVDDVADIITGAGETLAANAGAAILAANEAAADIGTAVQQAATGAAVTLGAIGTQVHNGFTGFLSGLYTQIAGVPTPGTGASQSQVNSVVTSQASVISAAAANISALNAQNSPGYSVKVLFSNYPGSLITLPALFSASSMSGWTNLPYINDGLSLGRATAGFARYNVAPTSSDYQTVSVVAADLNIQNWPTYGGSFYILGRCNSSGNTFVAAEFSKGSLQLSRFVGGTRLALGSPVTHEAISGATYELICGDVETLDPYEYVVTCNGLPILTYTDSAHDTEVGSSYRYAGYAQLTGTVGAGGPANYGAYLKSFAMWDNVDVTGAFNARILQGTYSSRPAAGVNPGLIYKCTDVDLECIDNGTSTFDSYIKGWKVTEPPSSGWSWVNQGGASVATEFGGERITAPSSTRNWRLRTRSLSPTSNYTATAYVDVAHKPATNYWWSGICLRNSSSGSFISFGPGYQTDTAMNQGLFVIRWTSATVFSAYSFQAQSYILPGGVIPNLLRIRDDGTNRYFEISINSGVDWMPVFSESRTAFITPDQFAFGIDNEGTAADARIRLRSLSGIA